MSFPSWLSLRPRMAARLAAACLAASLPACAHHEESIQRGSGTKGNALRQEPGLVDRFNRLSTSGESLSAEDAAALAFNNTDPSLQVAMGTKRFETANVEDGKKYGGPLKAFPFGKSSRFGEPFRTEDYAGGKKFATRDFNGTKDAAAGKMAFSQGDKAYAARSFATREAPGANKLFGTGAYGGTKAPYVLHGKSQDTYDALLEQQDLSIDQVRELLNKNR